MKYAKIFGVLGLAAAALMAFTSAVSASTLTSPIGTVVGKNSLFYAEAEAAVTLEKKESGRPLVRNRF